MEKISSDKRWLIILSIALVVLYVLHFTSTKTRKTVVKESLTTMLNDSTITLPIAYVNIDSLLINYNYAKDLNEVLLRKQESTQATLNQKQKELNTAAQEFDRKLRNNAFLTQERAQQEQERVLKMNQEYQQLGDRLAQEFMIEQQNLNAQIEDTIRAQIAEYNKYKNYEIIFSNSSTSTVLFARDKYNITKEITDYLNRQYGPTTKAAN